MLNPIIAPTLSSLLRRMHLFVLFVYEFVQLFVYECVSILFHGTLYIFDYYTCMNYIYYNMSIL